MGIQTIGLGSDNKLSMDTVDQLKEVDRNLLVLPIETDITETKEKNIALSEIITFLDSFKDITKTLSEDSLYLNRSAMVSAEGINVSLDKGVDAQSISIDVTQLAGNEVIQSDIFGSREDVISSGDGTFDIEVDGETYSFDVTLSTTLEDLMQMINDNENLNVMAKILNTGKDEYRLILSGSETGVENKISITESENLITNSSAEENLVQEAKDSKFIYNGIEVSRPSNSVSDIVIGIALEFTQITENPIKIDIKDDVSLIATELENFVNSYNALVVTLDGLTNFDEETEEAGIFQGNSDIRTIRRDINRTLLAIDSENRSIMDFGMTLNSVGTIDFDMNLFVKKYEESPSVVQNFFQGKDVTARGVTTHQDGVFYKLDNNLDRYIGDNSLLQNLSTSLQSQEDRLNKEKEKAIETLDNRYERMAQQFARQDSIIAQIEQQFKSIQMQIDMETNS